MIAKILNKQLQAIYGSKTGQLLTILIIVLLNIFLLLVNYQSIVNFVKGKALEPMAIVVIGLSMYLLYELYTCLQLSEQEDQETKQAEKKAGILQALIDNPEKKGYANLKDTFIFHEKLDYKIEAYLKKYAPVMPTEEKEEVVMEVPDISEYLSDKHEDDFLMDLSEDELKEMQAQQEALFNMDTDESKNKKAEETSLEEIKETTDENTENVVKIDNDTDEQNQEHAIEQEPMIERVEDNLSNEAETELNEPKNKFNKFDLKSGINNLVD